MTPRIGSLFSGVGGLDMAVEAFFGGETVWHCEWDEEPSKVLAARWPGVPNHRDVTQVDWATVEPVDIVCGGSPCQDVSISGPRNGMTEGTRSNLWVAMREAIAVLKPSVVIWENVRGALSAYAYSEMESEPGLLGESYGPDRPALRAAGRVVGDLSTLGYDSTWVTLRASDVGAPHRRERIFVLAYARGLRLDGGWHPAPGEAASGWASAVVGGRADASVALLGTPRVSSGHGAGDLDRRQAATNLESQVLLLPTPSASNANDRQGNVVGEVSWGEYEPAVRLWESLTRPAPGPTLPDGKNGNHRLAAVFPEWMMGYPAGHVTDIIGRNPAIKACGNGVVPQQAYAALDILWARAIEVEEVAA